LNDEALIQRFWDRDEAVLEAVKREYGSYCMYIAENVLQSRLDAEECLNDALLSAWNSIPPQRPQNLKTYLGKLIRESAVDRWRKNQAQKRISPASIVSLDELEELVGENTVEQASEGAELSRAISAFLRELSETERNLFIRRYWYYDSIEQICKRYGFGKSRVTVTLKRTRDKLAEHLKKEGYLI
jgi:RNA polymerase sigma-70 factor (ECF subfamily)